VQLAQQYQLLLHAHSDVDAVERLFRQFPGARILWAHSGFERPERIRDLLKRYPNLWCDLAFRSDHATNGKIDPEWRAMFIEFPGRFLLGTDTYTPERWHFVGELARWSRAWLADLPGEVAERIAFRNGDALIREIEKSRKP
jgi:predicted TIM-barrel fold metal-dependent hydrolase